MSDLRIEHVPIDSVHPDPANVRRHPERNLQAIRSSLARFGQVKPIVVDDKGIVRAGNGTLEAARQLGWDSIAVVRPGLDSIEATAYAIADNRTAELAEWDGEGLAEQLEALRSEGADVLEAAGYTGDEVDALLESLGDAAMDASGNEGGAADDPLPDKYEIVVECRDESHQRETFEALSGLGYTCRVLTF